MESLQIQHFTAFCVITFDFLKRIMLNNSRDNDHLQYTAQRSHLCIEEEERKEEERRMVV